MEHLLYGMESFPIIINMRSCFPTTNHSPCTAVYARIINL